jgi:hypothetical protein
MERQIGELILMRADYAFEDPHELSRAVNQISG